MDASQIYQISTLVDEKRWHVFDGLIRGRTERMVDVLTNFLSQMSPPQRTLTMKILSDYLIISDYREPAIDLLEKLCANIEGPLTLAPVKVKDSARVKSGDALIYEMDSRQSVVEGRELNFYDNPLEKRFWSGKGVKVLVDDFVGTGDQVIELLDSISQLEGNPKVDYLATLVIQEVGRERIEAHGTAVVSLVTRPKALEFIAKKSGEDIVDLRNLYLSIEDNTGCSAFESLGYKASEAAVTMKKTPDNTLPIFWHEGEKGWPAPFPRKTK